MITHFKDKNNKFKKRYKYYNFPNTILESVDTIVIIAATSTSTTLSITGIGLIFVPKSAGIACTLSLANKVLHKIILNKNFKYQKQFEKDQQTIKSLDNVDRKPLQDNVIDKNECEDLCNIFTKYVDEMKRNLFCKCDHKKIEVSFFELKFNLELEVKNFLISNINCSV